ncbi:MAG: hypothetical protein J5494_00975, partial [Candidatus Methanomethylophilaceae archaeon]|nr:hypothetical protein [Candidatus Methanomethylophilaceae archaeon]
SDCGHMASVPPDELTLLTGKLHAGNESFSVSFHDGEKTYRSEEIPITVTRAAHVVYNWEEDTLLCCDSLFSHFPKSSAENIPITVTVRDSAGNEVDPDARLPEGEYEITGVIEETEDFERWETTVPFSVCHFIEYSSSWPHVYGHIPGPTWTEAWEKCKFCDHIDAVYIFMDGIRELSSDLELLLPYEVTEVTSVTFDGTEIPGAFTEPLEPNKFYERTALRTEGEALRSLPDGVYRVLVTGKARTALNFWYEDNPVYYLEITVVLRH